MFHGLGAGQQSGYIPPCGWLFVRPLVFGTHWALAFHVNRPAFGASWHTAHQALNIV
jgi:hypothetical protein